MIFDEMTWTEIRKVPRDTLVVCPLGSTEQHGPHLPVGTDTLIVTAIAKALEKQRNMLLAPTLRLGHSPHHLSFGGTLSLEHAHYAQTLVQLAQCFARMGFVKLLFLNGHGGNRMPVSMALQSLKLAHPSLFACSCEYWQVAADLLAQQRESPIGGMGHACELETSLCMYLAPEKVRIDRIEDGGQMSDSPYFKNEMLHASPVSAVGDFEEFTDNGVFGMPSLASAEKGRRFFMSILDSMEGFIDALAAMDSPWTGRKREKECGI